MDRATAAATYCCQWVVESTPCHQLETLFFWPPDHTVLYSSPDFSSVLLGQFSYYHPASLLVSGSQTELRHTCVPREISRFAA